MSGADILIVVATAGEAALLGELGARLVVCGVGPVAAALATQRALLGGPAPALVVSAGIGGAFPGSGLQLGQAALASEMLYGDLGAWDEGEFLPLDALGLSALPEGAGTAAQRAGRFAAWDGGSAFAARAGLAYGPFVTLSSVTGSDEQAAALARRVPGVLIEGMEGAGVAHAAALHGVPCTELRGVSNPVGPRDRSGWQIGPALAAMTAGLAQLTQAVRG
ncbi:futalosine hydrolase [Deinococcus sp. KNUC1210]|uniref:futalosine hydrolase n=1 Tax=Deinococcus sp. KNUC1210 TaxID=2917691 RepID=UPI001EF0EA5D|nr:futalosine hydrolase [Deinococcus sp. KNUC1210]ULH16269.1 futalosine hydrolase [Deinococcus sp. KNUC1210]